MSSPVPGRLRGISGAYRSVLKWPVYGFAVLSAGGIFAMMLITVADVILRFFGRPITGAYDIVQIMGVLSITGALPYTTAVKGHVAIEYFYHKMSRRGRIGMDTFLRVLAMGLFGVLTYQAVRYGNQLRTSGQVTMTLHIPLFWVSYLIAVSGAVVVLVVFDNMLHPGEEMIKP